MRSVRGDARVPLVGSRRVERISATGGAVGSPHTTLCDSPSITGVEKRVGTIGAARATPERADLRRKVAIVVGRPRCRRHGFARRRRSLTPIASGLMTARAPRQRRSSSKCQRERNSRGGTLRSTSHSRAPTADVDNHRRKDLESAAAVCRPREGRSDVANPVSKIVTSPTIARFNARPEGHAHRRLDASERAVLRASGVHPAQRVPRSARI